MSPKPGATAESQKGNTMSRPFDVETLYAKFGPTIYARCKRLLKDPTAAEDATQDVFMKVLKHVDSAPGEEAVLPWIHRITTNHCLNVIRDTRRHAEPVEHVPEVVDDEFEDSVVTRDFANRLLAATPEELKAPAVMYHARGIEQSRVAAALGVSRRTVLYRLAEFTRRAMQMQEQA
jgi:RNA polymerase sigma-70 factor (ECF subfamily)